CWSSLIILCFFFSSRRRHTRSYGDWSSDVCSSDLAYDADRDAAIQRAHEQFRWFGLGWKVNADLPNPDSFEAATQFVTPEQVARSEERRVGKECRTRRAQREQNKKEQSRTG